MGRRYGNTCSVRDVRVTTVSLLRWLRLGGQKSPQRTNAPPLNRLLIERKDMSQEKKFCLAVITISLGGIIALAAAHL